MSMTTTQIHPSSAAGEAGPSDTSEDDRIARLVEIAAEACRDVERAARRLDAGLPPLLEARRRGLAVADMFGHDMTAVGYEFGSALKAVHRSLAVLRRELYRTAIDEEGLTLTEVARLTGNSRQRVARQVQRARDEAA